MIHKLNEGAQCAVSRAISTRPSQYQGAEEVSFHGTTESGRCVNPFSIRGADYAHTNTTNSPLPPGFSDLPTALPWDRTEEAKFFKLRRLVCTAFTTLLHNCKKEDVMSGKPAKGFQAMDQEHNALQFFSLLHPSLLAIYCYTICQKKENERKKKKLSVVILQQYCPNHKVRLNHFLFYDIPHHMPTFLYAILTPFQLWTSFMDSS